MVKDSGALDLNSAYAYLIVCEHFTDTCAIAKYGNKLAGFVTAYIPPTRSDRLFIWQIGVDNAFQRQGIGLRLLENLLARESCKDIRFLEATVTPSNKASQQLFTRFAKSRNTKLSISKYISSELFPGNHHEREDLLRIGPF